MGIRIHSICLALYSALCFSPSVKATDADLEARVKLAQKCIARKNLAQGRAILLALMRDPKCPASAYNEMTASYLEGAAYDMPGSMKDVDSWLATSLRKEPENGFTYVLIAHTYQIRGKYQESVSAGAKALTVKHPDDRGLQAQALAYSHMKKYPEATRYLNQYMERGHRSSLNYMLLGDLESAQKHYADAAIAYNGALRKDSGFQDRIFTNMIDCFCKAGQTDRAVEEVSKRLDMFKDDPALLDKRASLYESQKKYSAALSDYSKAISFATDSVYFSHRAHLYDLMGKHDLAVADRQRAKKSTDTTMYF